MKKFKNKIIVITGASSGIGRATALRFSKEGAKLALIDINREGLETLKAEVGQSESTARIFEADVTDESKIQDVVENIADEFGGIDVWVNNVGVAVYGEIGNVPMRDIRRVMDVNYFGQLNCIYAALPHLEKERSMGRLIGVSSVLSEISTPLNAPYSASKHALTGFYHCLHEELMHRKSKVKVSTILPSSIASPLFSNAKTYMGVRPKVFQPLYSPFLVADVILKRALKPQLSTIVGGAGSLAIVFYRFFPKQYHWLQSKLGYPLQKTNKQKSSDAANNLNGPVVEPGRIIGDQRFYIPSPVAKVIRLRWLLLSLGLARLMKHLR